MPNLPYNGADSADKKKITSSFGGLDRKAVEGAFYDGLNCSSHAYPALATRLGYARIAMRDEKSIPLVKSIRLQSVAATPAEYKPSWTVRALLPVGDGSGLVMVGDEAIAVYDYETATASEYALPAIEDGEEREIRAESCVSFTRRHESVASAHITYKYTYHITLILSVRLAYVKRVRQTLTDGEQTGWDSRIYTGRIGGSWDKAYGPDAWWSDAIEGTSTLSTWWGSGAGTSSPDQTVVHPGEAISLAEGQTVISTTDGELSALILPGIYATITQDYAAEGLTDKTQTSLMVDGFTPPRGGVYLDMDSPRASIAYSAAVLADDGGFAPRATEYITSGDRVAYAPPQGRYSIAVGDLPEGILGAYVHENRLWAYDETTIYASQLGRYETFAVDTTAASGWSVQLPGERRITGGISYRGRPVFFCEDAIVTVYGSTPATYSLSILDGWGVSADSPGSLRQCAGSLYYLSPAGIMRYTGNTPVCISDGLTDVQLCDGSAGADSRTYMLYARPTRTLDGEPPGLIYVHDTVRQSWHKAQYPGTSGYDDAPRPGYIESPVWAYAQWEPQRISHIVMLDNADRELYAVPTFQRQALIPGAIVRDEYCGYNDSHVWAARFGPYWMGTHDAKVLKTIYLRARLISQPRAELGADLRVRVCYDDADASLDERYIEDTDGWTEVYSLHIDGTHDTTGQEYADRMIAIPTEQRRFFGIKLEISGTERWEISYLSMDYERSGDRK